MKEDTKNNANEKITIYSFLKNADLTAMSAKTAISKLLNFHSLKRLNRYKEFSFDLQSTNKEAVESSFQDLLNTSYILGNPNKESFYLETPPTEINTAKEALFHLRVFSKKELRFDDLIKKVSAKTNIQVTQLSVSTLWELVLDKSDPNSTKEILTQKAIISSSISNGLLVNPLSDDYRLEEIKTKTPT